MKLSLFILSAIVSVAFSTPISQLFEPFGDFLQGNILNKNDGFYNSAQDFSAFYKQFASILENEEHMSGILKEFKEKFNKLYKDEIESEIRLDTLKRNLLKVFQHNADANNGKKSYTIAINQFSDMSIEEIISTVTGYFPSKEYESANEEKAKPETSYYDTTFDPYRAHQVTSIQNQGSCGACVYFAAAAVVESSWARRGHPLTVLSPQQLNDCAHDPRGNRGCQNGGGTFVPTFEYILKHGLTSMQNYPYLTKDANCDKQKESQAVAHISSWNPITPHGNEEALRKAVEQHGPVAVAIHVSDTWAHYKQGVYDDVCQGGRNHAVLVVGYGHEDASNKDFWIVKNQWGEGFGEHGYIRMRRNHNNMCDIAGDAVWVG